MKPRCFMASVDLKDAYYSVPASASDQKYLKFTCFPNGLACCPRLYTKLLKPVYASLIAGNRDMSHQDILMTPTYRVMTLLIVWQMSKPLLACLTHWVLYPTLTSLF
jgi:hypothetical protein